MSGDRRLEQLSPDLQRLIHVYVKRVGTVLGESLDGMFLYGSAVRGEYLEGHSNLNMLLVLRHVDGEGLRKMTPVLSAWKKEQVVSLVLTAAEVQNGAAHFPLEFGDLSEHRLLLAGRDHFPAMRPDPPALMETIAREMMENLLRVRQRFLEGNASSESALILMPLSITALGPCVRGLLRSWDLDSTQKTDLALQSVCDRLGVDGAPLLDAWSLRCGRISPGQLEIPRLFDRYLAGLQQLSDRLAASIGVARP